MKKILLSTVLVVLLLVLSTTFVFAAQTQLEEATEKADILYSMGLFKGTDEGYELDRAPTRAEALVMLIRLLGKEDIALSCTYTHPFKDVPSWADRYVAYGYKMGLTNGISKTEFGSNNTADSNMYLTFVLRALGYSDKNNADFSWDSPNGLAIQKGLIENVPNTTSFYRGDVVLVSYNGLNATIKSSDTRLYKKLENEGAISSNSNGIAIINVTKGTEKLSKKYETQCSTGTALKITATPSSYVDSIQYYWEEEGSSSRVTINSYYKTIYIPSDFEEDETYTLCIRTIDEDDNYSKWVTYMIGIIDDDEDDDIDEDTGVTITLSKDTTTLSTSKTYEYATGTELTVKASPSSDIDFIQYYWESEGSTSKEKISSYKGTIEIPDDFDDGDEDTLCIRAYTDDGKYTDWKEYDFEIDEDADEDDDDTGVTMTVKKGTTTLYTSKTYEYEIGTELTIKATPTSDIQSIQYYWSNTTSSDKTTVKSYTKTIEIPNDLTQGKTYYLYVRAYTDDYEYTDWKSYKIKIAEDEEDEETGLAIAVKYGTSTLSSTKVNEYEKGTELKVTVTPTSNVDSLQYYWDVNGSSSKKTVSTYTTTITIPEEFEIGETYILIVRATNKNGDISDWKEYEIEVVNENENTDGTADISVRVNKGTTTSSTSRLTANSTYEYETGTELTIYGYTTAKTSAVEYYWLNQGSDNKTTVSGTSTKITIPSTYTIGEKYTLYVRAKDTNGDWTSWATYLFTIKGNSAVSISVKYDGNTLDNTKTTEVTVGEDLIIKATPSSNVQRLQYAWDKTTTTYLKTEYNNTTTITIPSSFETGSTHKLNIRVYDVDGNYTDMIVYSVKIVRNVTSIELNKTTLSLEVDAEETLTATVLPTTATDKTVTWTSSSPDVARVDQNGKVIAIKAGTTTIMAVTKNDKIARCEVTVTTPAPVVTPET